MCCAITLTKLREQVRFHLRKKHDVNGEVRLAPNQDDSDPPCHDVTDDDPTPSTAAEFTDEFQKLLSSLDDEENQMVQFKLEQHTNGKIADRMGCSERTVRRIFKRVQGRLTRMLDEH